MPSRQSKELPAKIPRAGKRKAGRTPITETPLRLRMSGMAVTPAIERRTRQLLGRRLARFGTFIEKVEVRFKDINGPRGGADTVARIHLTVAGRPSVFVEERAEDADQALSRAASSVRRAMDRSVGKLGLGAPAPTREPGAAASKPVPAPARAARRAPPAAKRLRSAQKLGRRTRRAKHSPKARAARAQGQRRRAHRGR